MRTCQEIVRSRATRFALLLVLGAVELGAQPSRFAIDVGAAGYPWLAKSALNTSLTAQAALAQPFGMSLVGGLGWSFNLRDHSEPTGAATRRTDIGTARLGLESRPLRRGNARLFASASLAGSWLWHEYGGSASESGEANGGGWVSGIYGLRAQFGAPDAPGLSLRYEIRPRYGTLASFNPYFGIGIAF